MSKFSGVLLASDFDGTLRTSDGRVDDKDKTAIEYFTRNGGFFTVSTGRALAAFKNRFEVPVNAPVILSNGAVIYDQRSQRVLSETAIALPDKQVFEQIIRRFPTVGFEIYKGDAGYIINDSAMSRQHFEIIGVEPRFEVMERLEFPWTKVLLTGRLDELKPVKAFLDSGYSHLLDYVFSCEFLLEIMATGVNKGAGVLELARILGVGREHIYCAGDNFNDVDMLKIAKIGFAPENAEPEIKALAGQVVASNDEGCICEVIEHLDKIY